MLNHKITPLLVKIETHIKNLLFDPIEIERLKQDFARRFRKKALNRQSMLWKLNYYYSCLETRLLFYYRLSKACKVPLLRYFFRSLYLKCSIKTGIEFTTPIIGGGLIMPHWGRIILNAKKIGNDLYVFHNVTIGNDYVTGTPTLGNNIFIGTNSVILGNITIGDNVVIGACSFVNKDVPPNCIVAGNPAKVIRNIDSGYISEIIGY